MAGDKKTVPEKAEKKKFSRRDFVVGSGTAIAGGALTVVAPSKEATAAPAQGDYPQSEYYLVYDSKHCSGCYGCMTACSLAHDGEINFSLSRMETHPTPTTSLRAANHKF